MLKRPKSSPILDKRKTSQASRTVMACDYCRKQKTRCFRNLDSSSCLRCIYLKRPCLLDNSGSSHTNGSSSGLGPALLSLSSGDPNERLDSLQRTVNEVLQILKGGKSDPVTLNFAEFPSQPLDHFNGRNSDRSDLGSSAHPSIISGSSPYVRHRRIVAEDAYFQTPTNSFSVAPFSIIANQIPQTNIPHLILNLIGMDILATSASHSILTELALKPPRPPVDAISAGILTEDDAIDLMDDFRRNFGRWILFPLNMTSPVLIDKIRYKLSLLLTVCYCLSSRFSMNGITDPVIFEEKRNMHRLLLKQLVKDLSKSLLKYTCFTGGAGEGYIEFLQALVLLSIYSLSISSMCRSAFRGTVNDFVTEGFNDMFPASEFEAEFEPILKLDPWLLSGTGINIFVTRSTMGTLLLNSGGINSPFTVFQDELDSEEFQMLAVLRTYNHLTLVHLINCIFSGRMCVIDPLRLRYCTATLNLPSSTNFDGRMVSEIGILLICYNYVQGVLNENTENQTLIACTRHFKQVKREVDVWFRQWSYIFSQPAPQFVEPCYHFCCLVINFAYIFQKALLIDGGVDLSDSFMSKPKDINLFNEDNISFIINHCDNTALKELKMHAILTVRFINIIESDSYFAYLLDQVHFCFFFSGIVLLQILNVEKRSTNSVMTNPLPSEVESDVKLLILKFAMMSSSANSPDDITTRYCNGLEECYKQVYM